MIEPAPPVPGGDEPSATVDSEPPARGLHADELALRRAVAAVQAGDAARFADIYRECFPRVYGLCRLILGDAHEAEDATQETFLRALRALPGYEHRAGIPFTAWMVRIARNVSLTRLDRRGRVGELSDEITARLTTPSHDTAWVGDVPLALALERLSLRQRQILMLRIVLDRTPQETAAALGMTPAAVTKAQSRALARLRRMLSDGQECGEERCA